jgi:hypothetical protein
VSLEPANSRILANAIIGATKRDPDWTDFLYQHGWHVSQIEADYLISTGDRSAPLHVTPDIVLYNDNSKGLFLVECKLGEVDPLQRERYQLLTLTDARLSALEPVVAWHQVVYATTESYQATVEKGLSDTTFPLMVFKAEMVTMGRGTLTDASLQASLTPGIPLIGHIPTLYLRLDENSTHREVCLQLLVEILGFVVQGKRTFIVEDVCRAIFESMFEYMGGQFRNGMVTKIRRALAAMARPSAMGEWLTWKVDRWVFSEALIGDAATTGVSLQTVRNRVDAYLSQLGGQEVLGLT